MRFASALGISGVNSYRGATTISNGSLSLDELSDQETLDSFGRTGVNRASFNFSTDGDMDQNGAELGDIKGVDKSMTMSSTLAPMSGPAEEDSPRSRSEEESVDFGFGEKER